MAQRSPFHTLERPFKTVIDVTILNLISDEVQSRN